MQNKQNELLKKQITIETFGMWLKERRLNANYSVRELARQIGLSPIYISDIENSNRPAPRNEEILKKFINLFCLDEEEEIFFRKAAIASHTDDLSKYIKDKPQICVALRMSQDLPKSKVEKEWQRFIERLDKLNSGQDS